MPCSAWLAFDAVLGHYGYSDTMDGVYTNPAYVEEKRSKPFHEVSDPCH